MRLWFLDGSNWLWEDYEYATSNNVIQDIQITSPSPGSAVTSPLTVTWSDNLASYQYWIYAGSTKGRNDLYDSGSIASGTMSQSISGLPTTGKVWLRLWYRPSITVPWEYVEDVLYGNGPSITDPTASTTGSSYTFSWTAGGINPTDWWLYVGTSLGSADIADSLSLAGTSTMHTVSLPADGSTLFARLWYKVNGVWEYCDHEFTSN